MLCNQMVHDQIMNYKRLTFSIALVDLGGACPSDLIILHFVQFLTILVNRMLAPSLNPPIFPRGSVSTNYTEAWIRPYHLCERDNLS